MVKQPKPAIIAAIISPNFRPLRKRIALLPSEVNALRKLAGLEPLK